jgi:hypothetical protein
VQSFGGVGEALPKLGAHLGGAVPPVVIGRDTGGPGDLVQAQALVSWLFSHWLTIPWHPDPPKFSPLPKP